MDKVGVVKERSRMMEESHNVMVEGRDIADVMEFIEKRVGKGSEGVGRMLCLGLTVGEIAVALAKKDWPYNEPFDDTLCKLRREAGIMAEKIVEALV